MIGFAIFRTGNDHETWFMRYEIFYFNNLMIPIHIELRNYNKT